MMEKVNFDKIKKHIKEYRETYLFGTVAAMLVFLLLVMYKVDLEEKILPYVSHRTNQDEEQFIYNFTEGMKIEQQFTSYEDFDFITLSFSNHDQPLQGKIVIQITDGDSGEILIYEEKDVSGILYNVPVEISFADIGGGQAGKPYGITLQSVHADDIAIGVFGYKAEGGRALVDGNESEYGLSIGIHSYTGLFQGLTVIVLGVGSLAVFLSISGTFLLKLKAEQMFLLLAVPFASCMLMIWPGNSVYDEARHYHTVYHYSNMLLGHGEQDTLYQIKMRQCDIVNKEEIEENITSINSQAQYFWYYTDKMWEKAEDRSMVLVDVSDMPVVSDGAFIQYTPGIAGMTLGRLLGLNYYWTMTLTRVAIMGFYLVMCYYAIRKIPILKMLVVLVSALPLNLYQASGISYDSFTYAAGIVVFAFIIRLWKQGLRKKDWIKFGVAVFLLANCKGGVYLTLLLLMCLIPQEKYGEKKWLKIGGMLGIAGLSMLISFMPTITSWFLVQPDVPQASVVINSGGAVAQKLHPFFALKEPIAFLKLFVHTMTEYLDTYLGQLLGYRTAWSNEAISLVVMLPFLALLMMAAVKNEKETFDIGIKERLGILAISGIELVGMQTIFLIETPVYSNVILGFQGRYFVLFFPCILLLFRYSGVVYKEKKEYLYSCFAMAQLIYLYFFLDMFMCA